MVLQRAGLPSLHLNKPNPHRGLGIQRPTLIQRSGDLAPEHHLDTELFGELTVQCGLAGFSGFNLAARELPHAGIGNGCGTASGQQALWPAEVIHDCCPDYLLQF
ncbi:MAG: hypothetical protein K0Q86_2257 [Arthrobacter koreensis]|nr:hypothetical protein [Arthrobacter koreensis]